MDRRGEVRGKRKHPPPSDVDRPAKQMRPESRDPEALPTRRRRSAPMPPAHPPPPLLVESDSDEGSLLPLPIVAARDSAEWQATIESVVRAVVSIRFCQTCSFDTDSAGSSEATGFVVDAERGYILTNRHVVCAGPFWGYCVFDNHEEVRPSCTVIVVEPVRLLTFMLHSVMSILSIVTPYTTLDFSDSTQRRSSTCR